MRHAALALVVLALTACGSSAKQPNPSATRACPQTKHALAVLNADIAAIQKASLTTRTDSPQINKATDKFIADVSTLPIGNLKRNRMIDHAMGALHGQCESCLQALEAGRPIPSIHYGSKGCS
jgi:cytochrome c556